MSHHLLKSYFFFFFVFLHEKTLNLPAERNKKRCVEIEKQFRAAAGQLLYGSILFQIFVPTSTKIQTIWIV